MKHYYFMNKPEVVEEKEYEQKGGYTKYYYKKGEWEQYKRPRQQATPANLKKQRKIFYLFSILFIIAIFIVWKTTSNTKTQSVYNKQDKLLYSLKINKINNNDKQITVYIQNTLKKEMTLKKNFILEFFHTKNNKKILIKKLTNKINKTINPKENISIGKIHLPNSILQFSVIINKKIILQKN